MYRKILICTLLCSLFLSVNGCSDSNDSNPGNTNEDSLKLYYDYHEKASDYIWNDAEIVPITFIGSTITSNSAALSINDNTLSINAGGTYSLSGTLTNGQIVLNADSEAIIKIILNNVNITSQSTAPIFVKNAKKVIIISPLNTNNIITDGASYIQEDPINDEPNSTIFSKSDLTIYGSGSLKINSNYKDGISSKDGLILKDINLQVTSKDDALRGKDYIVIKDGSMNLKAGGDGLKSDNDIDSDRGFIFIEKGNIDITSKGDALSAKNKIDILSCEFKAVTGNGSDIKVEDGKSAKGFKSSKGIVIQDGIFNINSSDDAMNANSYIYINNGIFDLASADDAMFADNQIKINNGIFKISKSAEGIESPVITINNGVLDIYSKNDCINTSYGNGGEVYDASCLYINGGKLNINPVIGDGLDSNGDIIMTGGSVIIHGPVLAPEVAVDYNGKYDISGGVLIATGPNSGQMIQAVSNTSSLNSVLISSNTLTSNSPLIHIENANGNNVITFKALKNMYYILLASSEIKTGSDYNLFIGGTSTGKNINGLYSDGVYSGGNKVASFQIKERVTKVSF